jgi:hypothetical protein
VYLFSGAYFILDGQEQDICRNIDIKKPLWAVIDIYGNVKGKLLNSIFLALQMIITL